MQGFNFSSILLATPSQQPAQQQMTNAQFQAQPVAGQAPQVSLTGGIRTPTPVFFCSEKDPVTGYLSNWFYSPFVGTNGGERYVGVEQYFMQKKARAMGDYETEDKIMEITLDDQQAQNPDLVHETMKRIKDLGREVKNFNQELWDQIKVGVVEQALFYKFAQNQELLKRLMLTQNDILFEAASYDKEWGIGLDEANARQLAGAQWNITIFSVEQIPLFFEQHGKNLLGKTLMSVRQKFREFGIPSWAVTLSDKAKEAIAKRDEAKNKHVEVVNQESPKQEESAKQEETIKEGTPGETVSKTGLIDDHTYYPPVEPEVVEDEDPVTPREDSTQSDEDVPVNPEDIKKALSANIDDVKK